MEDASAHSNCNNKFEVYHHHASVFMICIPIPSEGVLVYYYDFIIIILLQNLCVRYLIGQRNNQKKKKERKKNFTRLFSSSVSEASKFFHTYSWDGVFLTCHLQMCIWEFLVFSFFFLKFWINKWMRTTDCLFYFIPTEATQVWNVILRRSTLLRLPIWRVLQLVEHDLNEALEQRYQSVSWGQAARWGHMDEGCSPLTMIQRAVICKITQVPEEEDQERYLTFLECLSAQCRNSCLPASVSWIYDIHPSFLELFGHIPHVYDRVQFLWSSFQTAVTRRTEATHIFISVSTVLRGLFQDDNTGASGYAQMHSKLKRKTLNIHLLPPH